MGRGRGGEERARWAVTSGGPSREGGQLGALTVELHHGAERSLQLLVDIDHGEGAIVCVHDAHVQVAQGCRGGGHAAMEKCTGPRH